jgi:phosphoglycolate phosphatase-like HAD superfamily hydrolase
MPTRCYLFDLDGTLADCTHRLHHIKGSRRNWRAFFASCSKDGPIPHMVELAKHLMKVEKVVFVSGRSDEVRAATEQWLKEHQLKGPLYMRRANDRRSDFIVKAELLDHLLADGFRPIMAFDDRDQVVKMWRKRGIPCAQVAEGDF